MKLNWYAEEWAAVVTPTNGKKQKQKKKKAALLLFKVENGAVTVSNIKQSGGKSGRW